MPETHTTDITQARFSHARLEEVIYGRVPLAQIIGHEPSQLGNYVVVDFVGSHQIDQERFAAGDLIQASARIFFEDSGAFVTSFEGEAHDKPFNLVLFATFVVIEIAPYTPRAKFVVLAPPAPATAETPYAGLVRANNTDLLRERLEAADDLGNVFTDIETLLIALTRDPVEAPRAGLLQRIFKR
jgi:hypothetical protein